MLTSANYIAYTVRGNGTAQCNQRSLYTLPKEHATKCLTVNG